MAIRLLCGVFIMLVAGCSTARPLRIPPPTVAKVSARVAAVRVAVADIKTATVSAKTHVIAAQASTESLFEVTTLEYRPLVARVREDLAGTFAELDAVTVKADAAAVQLAEAEVQAQLLQVQIDEQTRAFEQSQTARRELADKNEALTAARNLQTRLAWKWRALSAGMAAAVACFFVARQYFPFLKVF